MPPLILPSIFSCSKCFQSNAFFEVVAAELLGAFPQGRIAGLSCLKVWNADAHFFTDRLHELVHTSIKLPIMLLGEPLQLHSLAYHHPEPIPRVPLAPSKHGNVTYLGEGGVAVDTDQAFEFLVQPPCDYRLVAQFEPVFKLTGEVFVEHGNPLLKVPRFSAFGTYARTFFTHAVTQDALKRNACVSALQPQNSDKIALPIDLDMCMLVSMRENQ